ncbi:MAG: hypothetical protein R6V01_07765 [Thermoplasmatota archaeon]
MIWRAGHSFNEQKGTYSGYIGFFGRIKYIYPPKEVIVKDERCRVSNDRRLQRRSEAFRTHP